MRTAGRAADRETWPKAPIVLLSQYVVISYAAELIESGEQSTGYLLKDRVFDIRSFLDSIERVAGGGVAIDPDVVAQVLVSRRRGPLDELTEREREVLELMGEGLKRDLASPVHQRGRSKHTARVRWAERGCQHPPSGQRRADAAAAGLTGGRLLVPLSRRMRRRLSPVRQRPTGIVDAPGSSGLAPRRCWQVTRRATSR